MISFTATRIEDPTYFVTLFFLLKELPPEDDFGGLFRYFLQHSKVIRPSSRDRGAGVMSYTLSAPHCWGINEVEESRVEDIGAEGYM
jgi:hypothetical protein